MNASSAIYQLWRRELLRFTRQRSRWIGALATPLLFWLLIGGGLGTSFRDPTQSSPGGYLEFFYPGSVVLSVLFTAIFSTMSVIEDRHQGFLQGVLVAPVPRSTFVFAKILGGATLSTLQGGLLLALAPLAGIGLTLPRVAALLVLLFIIGAALTALGFVFAWKIDSVQGYHGIMNMVLVPMWILSGAVFPSSGGFGVFSWLQKINPLAYGVKAFRGILFHPQVVPLLMQVSIVILFGACMTYLSVRAVDSRKKVSRI